jgi:hypothetical protein
MKPRSAKNKGNRFENYLIEYLRENLDSKAQRTYGSGSGLDKQDVRLPSYDIEIEAKNQKVIHLLDWWEQCKRQEYGNMAVLCLRNPRKPEFTESLIVMGLDDWVELVKKQKEQVEVINNFDRDLKWRIKNLEKAAHEVFKNLNG